MKTVVFLCDGAADRYIPELSGTAFDAAKHPHMDRLASEGLFGLAKTVPDGMPAGSDTANLSVFGFDPRKYYTGRSPLEALSLGIPLGSGDVAYRVNTVRLSKADRLGDAVMEDYSGGEPEDTGELIAAAQKVFGSDRIRLYKGFSYRNCLVIKNGETGGEQTPPHDISGKKIGGYLPQGENAALLRELIEWSYEHLPLTLWPWGEGRRPALPSFEKTFGLSGAVISAVDLVRGIGVGAGLDIIKVKGATGLYTTDFAAKGRAAIDALKTHDFVYVHVEAPDECGHHAQVREKVFSIEQIDEKIAGPVMRFLESGSEPYSVLCMPDHPTPVSVMTHTPDPVPFALYRTDGAYGGDKAVPRPRRYTEAEAEKTGVFVPAAHTLMPLAAKAFTR